MSEVLQLVGAMLVLAGFGLMQAGRLHPARVPYLAINAAGSGLLAVLASIDQQWGFLLLEGTWCVFSLAGLVRVARQSSKRNQDAGPGGPASSS